MKCLIGLLFTLLFSLTLAQEDSGFVQEDAHEHGAATLNVVLDGEDLTMEFISPAVNLVGFEYEPSTDADVQAVNGVLAVLEDASALFATTGNADCTLASAETEHVMTDEDGHEHGEEDEHAEDEDHDEDEDHGEDDRDGEHSEAEEHGGEAQHSEFHAAYSFSCASPDALSGLDLGGLFAAFSSVEDVDVQYVLPAGQGAAELRAANAVVTF